MLGRQTDGQTVRQLNVREMLSDNFDCKFIEKLQIFISRKYKHTFQVYIKVHLGGIIEVH